MSTRGYRNEVGASKRVAVPMRELAPGILLALMGCTQAVIWYLSRRRESVWNKTIKAYSQIWSPRFARGYGGASIILAVGLIVFGLGNTLAGWLTLNYRDKGLPTPDGLNDLAANMMLTMPVLLVATGLSVYAMRPRFLFPAHIWQRDLTGSPPVPHP